MDTLKGRSYDEWIKWIDEELKPPRKVSQAQAYVLEALKEAIEKIRTLNV